MSHPDEQPPTPDGPVTRPPGKPGRKPGTPVPPYRRGADRPGYTPAATQIRQQIAQTLLARRQALGLSAREVARRSDLPLGSVRRLETAGGDPQIGTIHAAAQALGLTLDIRLTEPDDGDLA